MGYITSNYRVWVGTGKNIIELPAGSFSLRKEPQVNNADYIRGVSIHKFPPREQVAVARNSNHLDPRTHVTYVYIWAGNNYTYRATVYYAPQFVENEQSLSNAFKILDLLDGADDNKIDLILAYKFIGKGYALPGIEGGRLLDGSEYIQKMYGNYDVNKDKWVSPQEINTLHKVLLKSLNSDELAVYKALRFLEGNELLYVSKIFPDAFSGRFDENKINSFLANFANSLIYGKTLFNVRFDFNDDSLINAADSAILNKVLGLLGYQSCSGSSVCEDENKKLYQATKTCAECSGNNEVSKPCLALISQTQNKEE